MWMALLLAVSTSALVAASTLEDALALERAGQDAQAMSALDRLIRRAPTDPLLRLESARLRLKLGTPAALDRAEFDLHAARALAPENARGHYLWGLLLEERGAQTAALSAYQTAVLLRPDWAEARSRLAGLSFARGDFEAAEVHYRALLAEEPGSVPAGLQLAATLERQGKVAEAVGELERLWALAPRSPAVGNRLAALYEQAGRQADAERLRSELAGPQRKLRPLGPSRR
jgi:tetratricopeptide (TPR) repeat protein